MVNWIMASFLLLPKNERSNFDTKTLILLHLLKAHSRFRMNGFIHKSGHPSHGCLCESSSESSIFGSTEPLFILIYIHTWWMFCDFALSFSRGQLRSSLLSHMVMGFYVGGISSFNGAHIRDFTSFSACLKKSLNEYSSDY